MFNIKTQNNTIKVLDSLTGNVKCNIPISGTMQGNAQLQGDRVIVQLSEGSNTRVKVYDAKTGNLKGNYV